ncbi:hypothetical protein DSUL_50382 [Desulfovibrionales bacterium]
MSSPQLEQPSTKIWHTVSPAIQPLTSTVTVQKNTYDERTAQNENPHHPDPSNNLRTKKYIL